MPKMITIVSIHMIFIITLSHIKFHLTFEVNMDKIHLKYDSLWVRSDQISCSVMSDCLQPHEWQHARPPCPSPTPGVHSDSRLLSQ